MLKILYLLNVLLMIGSMDAARAGSSYSDVMVVSGGEAEDVDLNLLNSEEKQVPVLQSNNLKGSRLDSMVETKRKSFNSYKNVKDISSSEVMEIKTFR